MRHVHRRIPCMTSGYTAAYKLFSNFTGDGFCIAPPAGGLIAGPFGALGSTRFSGVLGVLGVLFLAGAGSVLLPAYANTHVAHSMMIKPICFFIYTLHKL